MTNKEFTKDDYFRACCVRANSIEPTRIDPTARRHLSFVEKWEVLIKIESERR